MTINHTCIRSALLAAAIAFVPSALAQTLSPGEPAPKLEVGTWLKGTPVTSFKHGNLYLVEFWATWCGPCRQSAPILSKLAKEYAGKLTVIGIDVWERDPSLAAPFIAKNGADMDYDLCTDKGGVMDKTWMKAANQKGIPTAFLVGKTGKIEYIGSPFSLENDQVIRKCIAGTWDIDKYRAQALRDQESQILANAIVKAANQKKWGAAKDGIAKLKSFSGNGYAIAHSLEVQMQRSSHDAEGLSASFAGSWNDLQFVMGEQAKAADAASEQALLDAEDSEAALLRKQADTVELSKLKICLEARDSKRFARLASDLVNKLGVNSADTLDAVAWRIAGPDYADPKTPPYSDMMAHTDSCRTIQLLELAQKAVKRAIELSGSKNVSYFDTFAWVQYRKGDAAAAAKTELAASEEIRDIDTKKFYALVAKWFQSRIAKS